MSRKETIPIASDTDVVAARQRGRLLASDLGFGSVDQIAVATAISELARNILEYAKRGEIVLTEVHDGEAHGNGLRNVGIEVVAEDRGPGIQDVALALRDGYSTSRSLGLGLPGAKRLMDDFDIRSEPGKGTRVTIRKWLR